MCIPSSDTSSLRNSFTGTVERRLLEIWKSTTEIWTTKLTEYVSIWEFNKTVTSKQPQHSSHYRGTSPARYYKNRDTDFPIFTAFIVLITKMFKRNGIDTMIKFIDHDQIKTLNWVHYVWRVFLESTENRMKLKALQWLMLWSFFNLVWFWDSVP